MRRGRRRLRGTTNTCNKPLSPLCSASLSLLRPRHFFSRLVHSCLSPLPSRSIVCVLTTTTTSPTPFCFMNFRSPFSTRAAYCFVPSRRFSSASALLCSFALAVGMHMFVVLMLLPVFCLLLLFGPCVVLFIISLCLDCFFSLFVCATTKTNSKTILYCALYCADSYVFLSVPLWTGVMSSLSPLLNEGVVFSTLVGATNSTGEDSPRTCVSVGLYPSGAITDSFACFIFVYFYQRIERHCTPHWQ